MEINTQSLPSTRGWQINNFIPSQVQSHLFPPASDQERTKEIVHVNALKKIKGSAHGAFVGDFCSNTKSSTLVCRLEWGRHTSSYHALSIHLYCNTYPKSSLFSIPSPTEIQDYMLTHTHSVANHCHWMVRQEDKEWEHLWSHFSAKMERITTHPEVMSLGNSLTLNPDFSHMSSFGQGDIIKWSTSEIWKMLRYWVSASQETTISMSPRMRETRPDHAWVTPSQPPAMGVKPFSTILGIRWASLYHEIMKNIKSIKTTRF